MEHAHAQMLTLLKNRECQCEVWVREGLTEEMAFKPHPEGEEGMSYAGISVKHSSWDTAM